MPLVSLLDLADGDKGQEHKLHAITNVNGGSVAIGHPMGATGARLVITLINQLRTKGGGLGVAAICGGYGQGEAILLRVGDVR
jgi:acetyl-CoA C-acetyltransferase